MRFGRYFLMIVFTGMLLTLSAQEEEDLLSLLGEEEITTLTLATFKANRVVNLHSVENTANGELDIKISHRFGELRGQFYQMFGLDDATVRIGGDYGVTERLMIGVGRSSFEKTYDGFAKYKLLRQSTGKINMPVSVCVLGTIAVKTEKFQDTTRENFFSSKMYYTGQLIIGRKISNAFSIQLSPTIVHRNLVLTDSEKNDVLALGAAARIKLGKRTSLNGEYIYVLPDQIDPARYRNSFSIGFDIETGGHVFQLHFTNSTSMIEKGFITETDGDWSKGGVHFGFNISRVFNIKKG